MTNKIESLALLFKIEQRQKKLNETLQKDPKERTYNNFNKENYLKF